MSFPGAGFWGPRRRVSRPARTVAAVGLETPDRRPGPGRSIPLLPGRKGERLPCRVPQSRQRHMQFGVERGRIPSLRDRAGLRRHATDTHDRQSRRVREYRPASRPEQLVSMSVHVGNTRARSMRRSQSAARRRPQLLSEGHRSRSPPRSVVKTQVDAPSGARPVPPGMCRPHTTDDAHGWWHDRGPGTATCSTATRSATSPAPTCCATWAAARKPDRSTDASWHGPSTPPQQALLKADRVGPDRQANQRGVGNALRA